MYHAVECKSLGEGNSCKSSVFKVLCCMGLRQDMWCGKRGHGVWEECNAASHVVRVDARRITRVRGGWRGTICAPFFVCRELSGGFAKAV